MTRLLTLEQVQALGVAFTRQHLYRLEQSGDFPQRIKLGQSRIVWDAGEIESWIAARLAARPRRAQTRVPGADDFTDLVPTPAPAGTVPAGCRRGRAAGRRDGAA